MLRVSKRVSLAAMLLLVAFGVSGAGPSVAGAEPVLTSFYGGTDGYCGALTASGEVYDCEGMTAAHLYLPFGTVLEVCFDACATVTVTDRCACALDLSLAAAKATGVATAGVGVTEVTVL